MMNNYPELPAEDDDDDEMILISKSQLKRESHALTDLGKRLVELPRSQLGKIPLEEGLAEAVALAHRIKERGGHKRQLQYIGKLLRTTDAEPIIAALEKLEIEHAQENARLHRLEQWRERLLKEGDSALGELLADNPGLDRQQLRQLLRNAQKEQEQNKPPKSSRELFKFLRDHIEV